MGGWGELRSAHLITQQACRDSWPLFKCRAVEFPSIWEVLGSECQRG